MESERLCEYCGTVIVVSALIFVFAIPPILCEKCKGHDHEPHTHQESKQPAFINITMSGIGTSAFVLYK